MKRMLTWFWILSVFVDYNYGIGEPAVLSANKTEKCEAIHAKGHGINLVCCNKSSPLTSDCEFHPLCRSNLCRCHLSVSSKLDCYPEPGFYSTNARILLNTSYPWKDHAQPPPEPFNCFYPNFPNQKSASFVLNVNAMSDNLAYLFEGLDSYKVASLIVDAAVNDSFTDSINLSTSFPALKTISIKNTGPRANIGQLSDFMEGLEELEHLTLINVDFEFGSIPKWVHTVTKIHVEQADLEALPKWLAFAKNLKRLTIQKTRLQSAVVVSQLPSLVSLNLDDNNIDDLYSVSFASKNVLEISIENNQIKSIGPHTFIQCLGLRILDLSKNFITFLPQKAFQLNDKLKVLKLDSNHIHELKLQHFVGLQTLRTLSLSNNPLDLVDPFTFLPLSKTLRILQMNGCNLTQVPLAVTQLCLLESLELNDNKLFDAESMPAEVLALISNLKHISFERNPLMRFPEGLLLIPPNNEEALIEVIDTLIQLPVWSQEPCVPYMWNMHLKNSSSLLRRKVAIWNESRMLKNNLKHCEYLYEHAVENLQLYAELSENSGCEANRRLRRFRETCENKKQQPPRNQKQQPRQPPSSPSGVLIVERPLNHSTINNQHLVLIGSLLINALFVVIFISALAYGIGSKIVKHPKRREGFEEIQGC